MTKTQLYFISVAILSLLLLACAGKQAKGENGIVGKWELVKLELDVITSDSVATAKFKESMDKTATTKDIEGNNMNMTFTENGILTISGGGTGTYGIEGNKLRIRMQGDVIFNNFKIERDTLIMYLDMKEIAGNNLKDGVDIGDDVEIEKLVIIEHFVRK